VSFEGAVGIETTDAHAVWVGDETKFTFKVSPIIDDPETPVDEYFSYYYEFSPFIYRHLEEDNGYFAVYYRVTSLGPGYR